MNGKILEYAFSVLSKLKTQKIEGRWAGWFAGRGGEQTNKKRK